MGKKNVNSVTKSKEKRDARKQEQRRIADGMSCVTLANKLTDLAPLCQELLLYNSKNIEVEMYIQKVTELDKKILNWAIDLTESNMKNLYETCAWGWNRIRKVEEMTDDTAWYIIAKDVKGKPLAFSHFRFDMDFGDPVLYCYEVQVEASGQRRGLGARLLAVLEKLSRSTRMRCVRLTALTHNPSAVAFFRACGYTKDETSPPKEEAAHYEILSKASDSLTTNVRTEEPQTAPESSLNERIRTVSVE